MIAAPLRSAGVIDSVALDKARAHQKQHGGLLSNALLELKVLRETDFLRVLGEVYAARPVKSDKLATLKLDQALLDKVPARLAERLRLCPIRWDERAKEVHVVAVVPVSGQLEAELRRIFPAAKVSVYVATAAGVYALIHRWYYREADAFAQVDANGAGPHQQPKTNQFAQFSAAPNDGDEEPPASVTRDRGSAAGLTLEDPPEERGSKTLIANVSDTLTIATLRKENERFRVAQEFHRRVTLERDFDSVLDRILAVLFELLPAEASAIFLTSGRLVTKSKKGGGDQLNVSRTILDQTLVSPAGVLVNDALIDQRFDRSKSVMIRGVRSVMAVPLRTRSRTLGVLYIESVTTSAAFTEEDLPLLNSIGAQAAILLDNAELIAKVQQEVENRANLQRFLSPAAVEEVLSGRLNVKLDGQSAEVTTLFADIRGFTTMSETMPAVEVVRFLNHFFGEMVEAVEQHHGTVDKYIGDCVMALWGAPEPKPDDARNALMAALNMVERAKKISVKGKPLEMGVGITTGQVVLGCIGSKRRLDYTAIGSNVNLAARLCGIAKPGEVLCSRDTMLRAGPGVVAQPNDAVALKGIESQIVPYTVKSVGAPVAQPIRLYTVAAQPAAKTQPLPPPPPPPRKR